MDGAQPTQAYLALANELFEGRIAEDDLQPFTAQLPPLDNNLLDKLAQHAEETAQTQPRLGWAIARVANATTREQGASLFIQSLSAFYLARAANHWAQPKLVAEAIERAHQGFESLNEIGWLAACDWQNNALVWTKPNIAKTADILEKAAEGLKTANTDEFVPHCRLALAYAQVLIGKYKEAEKNILASDAFFTERGDTVNQARCWVTAASYFRRRSHFDLALEKLERAMRIFQNENLPIDIAHTYSQIALIHLLRTDDLSTAASHFNQAAQIFATHDLDLWQAACMTYLGSIYMQNAQFVKADQCYQQARTTFRYHAILGLLADNLNDNGKLNQLRGSLNTSIEQYKQALDLHRQIGSKPSAAVVTFNLGEVFGQIGRYQDALHYLEQAAEQLKIIGDYLRLGTCERYTALIWHRLGQAKLAHEFLDKAIVHYNKAGQKAYIASVHNYRAGILFEHGDFKEAIECLEKSLEIAHQYNLILQANLAKRLLGEAFLRSRKYDIAKQYLDEALLNFTQLGMNLEKAICLVAIGRYHIELSEYSEAKTALEEALHISQCNFPEIDWRSYAGLAELAEDRNQISDATTAYHQGIQALDSIRNNFWQPSLAGSYLQTPASFFDKAVLMATKTGNSIEAIQFVESSKATTLLQQLAAHFPAGDRSSNELNDLRGEIDWLQEQLRISFDRTNPLGSAIRTRQMRTQLADKVTKYDGLLGKLERKRHANPGTSSLPFLFDLTEFKKSACNYLGEDWVALDYYLTDEQLIFLMISPDECKVQISPFPSRIRMALEAFNKVHQDITPPLDSDLSVLGEWLIPPMIATKIITSETVLLLSPHRRLHGIPWAALRPGFSNRHLADLCIPSITPSLRSLAFLWGKATAKKHTSPKQGLVIGLSRFPHGKKELPAVKEEIRILRTTLGKNAEYLVEHEATWENIQSLQSQDSDRGLSRFAFLHFAGHASADVRSGRLSGFSLWDGEIRLDQLRELAPLPNLVSLSACSGNYSYVFEGDEHMGLSATCFFSGVKSVVGSTRPIRDSVATQFTTTFYRNHMGGSSPAQALAYAQREIIKSGEKVTDWASLACMGVP